MSFDFSKIAELSTARGKLVELKNSAGRVIWAAQGESNEPIILEVEKITSNTYVSSTSYTGEQFLMLDIYPKTASSTVNVTYGGLTKTLTFTSTDARKVYFGTYGGVADSVVTPASGTLTIEGDCIAVGISSYNSAKSTTTKCDCITAIMDTGSLDSIQSGSFDQSKSLIRASIKCATIEIVAFRNCDVLTQLTLANTVTSIGSRAFYDCGALTSVTIPESVISIESSAFYDCGALTSVTIKNGTIGDEAFYHCNALTNLVLSEGVTSIGNSAFVCEALTNVTIPSTVTYIGDYAFGDVDPNRSLTVTMLSSTPPVVGEAETGSGLFGSQMQVAIIVPAGCGEVYRTTAGWSRYADYITEVSR